MLRQFVQPSENDEEKSIVWRVPDVLTGTWGHAKERISADDTPVTDTFGPAVMVAEDGVFIENLRQESFVPFEVPVDSTVVSLR